MNGSEKGGPPHSSSGPIRAKKISSPESRSSTATPGLSLSLGLSHHRRRPAGQLAGWLLPFEFHRKALYSHGEYISFSPARFARRGAVAFVPQGNSCVHRGDAVCLGYQEHSCGTGGTASPRRAEGGGLGLGLGIAGELKRRSPTQLHRAQNHRRKRGPKKEVLHTASGQSLSLQAAHENETREKIRRGKK